MNRGPIVIVRDPSVADVSDLLERIATIHRDVVALRGDLLRFLNGITLELLPLRERRSEIESHHLLLDLRNSKSRTDAILPMASEDFFAVAQEHNGNASAMARALHTSRSQVRRLATRFDVDLDRLRRALR